MADVAPRNRTAHAGKAIVVVLYVCSATVALTAVLAYWLADDRDFGRFCAVQSVLLALLALVHHHAARGTSTGRSTI
jgi:hydrogenase-4 membrane subunit HyfE